ncbi:rRNA N-glycosidase [Striga asiatica]|uniref:rRNA N-glycosylase n=1 Tax=Striga asiatica TaxID=4170 RepID=A0A5A7QX80_STRAF|nr:rRNA N-glycosidase [Striga asiatica]
MLGGFKTRYITFGFLGGDKQARQGNPILRERGTLNMNVFEIGSGDFNEFIHNLRDALSDTRFECHGKKVLKDIAGPFEFILRDEMRQLEATITLGQNDLYVYGFVSGGNRREIKSGGPQLIRMSQDLPFDESYGSMMKTAFPNKKQLLEDVKVGSFELLLALRSFAASDKSQSLARGILVVALMLSESIRSDEVLKDYYSELFDEMPDKMKELFKHVEEVKESVGMVKNVMILVKLPGNRGSSEWRLGDREVHIPHH